MIKLIVSDVDGTLVPDGSFDINEELFDVIKQLKKKGIQFVVSSGRQYASLRRLFAPVADEVLYITDNGGFVRGSDGELLQKNAMDKQLVRDLVADSSNMPDIDVMLCGKDFAYVKDADSYLFRWMRDSYHYDVKAENDIANVDDDIVKVSLFHMENAEPVVREWFYDKWIDKTLIAAAGVNWMDCIPGDSNKGTALKYIMDRLKLASNEVMVFGDNINDLEMLALSDYSYAIGSAREEVKEAANYVADTMENQGVIKTIKEQILKN